jgi:hypothetical protein
MKRIKNLEDFEVNESFATLDQYVSGFTSSIKAADSALESFQDENGKNALMSDIQKTAKDLRAELKKVIDKAKAAGIWDEGKK